ncbi:helix-turn-helix domain-containing protein [Georgenia sp. SUBG003]|uniref:helix-turn-helix domain-containing protein n=1 Tax=Georgenia sp. SUBG003 TaxID=1497974 RepID=UPI000B00E702
MPIVVDIDVMLARRKMAVGTLADRIGITPANLAVLKNGRAKAVRFTTLEALCEVLDCQPGDLLRFEAGTEVGDAAAGGQVPETEAGDAPGRHSSAARGSGKRPAR